MGASVGVSVGCVGVIKKMDNFPFCFLSIYTRSGFVLTASLILFEIGLWNINVVEFEEIDLGWVGVGLVG